jgi:hypothetical protein
MTNPLQKYFRQPKLYISLPSKGMFYAEGALVGDPNNFPILAMTGMDEILMKTPDALLNGEATVKIIESCCPYIKNAWSIPSIDLDSILIGIRIATYGDTLTLDNNCSQCGTENTYDVDLKTITDYFSNCKLNYNLRLDPISIVFKPLSYKELTEESLISFSLRRQVFQAAELTDVDAQQKVLEEAYSKLADLKANVVIKRIDSVQTIENVVEDTNFISEWIQNTDNSVFDTITKFLDDDQNVWNIPKFHAKCTSCEHVDDVSINLDQSSFFVQAS